MKLDSDRPAHARETAAKPTALFSTRDLADGVMTFAERLKERSDAMSKYVFDRFSEDAQVLIARYQHSDAAADALRPVLVRELNRIVQDSCIHETHRFAHVILSDATQRLLKGDPESKDLALLNRLLLEDAFPHELSRRERARSRIGGIVTCQPLLGLLGKDGLNEPWRLLYSIYGHAIWAYAVRRGLTEDEAEAVVQDTMVVVMCAFQPNPKDLSQGRQRSYEVERGPFRRWLSGIVGNKVHGALRQRAPGGRNRISLEVPGPDGERPLAETLPTSDRDNPLLLTTLDEEIERLNQEVIPRVRARVKRSSRDPERDLDVLDEYILKKRPAKEVARELEITVGNLYVIASHLMTAMREEWPDNLG